MQYIVEDISIPGVSGIYSLRFKLCLIGKWQIVRFTEFYILHSYHLRVDCLIKTSYKNILEHFKIVNYFV